jgi:hypothetical protein
MPESVANSVDEGGNRRAGQFGMLGIIGTGRRGSDPAETNCSDSPRNESLA